MRTEFVCGSYGQDSGLAAPKLLFSKAMFSYSDLANRKKQNSPLPAGVALGDDPALSSRLTCSLKGLFPPVASSTDMPWITESLIPAESSAFSFGPAAFIVQRKVQLKWLKQFISLSLYSRRFLLGEPLLRKAVVTNPRGATGCRSHRQRFAGLYGNRL